MIAVSRWVMLAQLRGALKLEIAGMKRRGQSAYAQAKELYELKGNKKRVLEQIEEMIKEERENG